MALKIASGFNTSATKQFVDTLVSKGLLKAGFQQVLSGRTFAEIEDYLITKKLLTTEQISHEYAEFFSLPFVDLAKIEIPTNTLALLPVDVAEQYGIVAYQLTGVDLYLAIGKPSTLQRGAPTAITNIRKQKGLHLHLAVAQEAQVKECLAKLANNSSQGSESFVSGSQRGAGQSTQVQSLNKQDLINEVEPRAKFVDLKKLVISNDVINKIPQSVARKYNLVVFDVIKANSSLEPTLIKIASPDLENPHVKEIISYITQRNHVLVDKYTTDHASFDKALTFYGGNSAVVLPPAPEPTSAERADIIKGPPIIEATPVGGVFYDPSDSANAQIQKDINPYAPKIPLSNQIPARPLTDSGNKNSTQEIAQNITSPDQLAVIVKQGVVPQIVSAMLSLAINMKASDIHVEAEKDALRIRFRIDGILHDILRMPQSFHAPLISRIKILSKMKIDETRIPQDGRFDVAMNGHEVDLRISTMPTVHGEKVVTRLLDKSEGIKSLEQLGVTGTNFDSLIKAINKPYGIVLATGPTGSGKSTTLYAVLSRISKPGVNIVTLEDPVEYELPGINQAQVKPQIGFDFAEGLRSVLRQDPNVIMVGEIRDLETAAMATQAALTGHLVFSTLHTNNSAGALPRLIDMGVEPYLITSSINAVLSQRLVRKICDNCREMIAVPDAVVSYVNDQLRGIPSASLQEINPEKLVFYRGKGCSQCTKGFRGRMGIFEVLSMSEKIEELAIKKVAATEIQKQAVAEGMMTMLQDGLLKALKGITTIDEVLRVTTSDINGGEKFDVRD